MPGIAMLDRLSDGLRRRVFQGDGTCHADAVVVRVLSLETVPRLETGPWRNGRIKAAG